MKGTPLTDPIVTYMTQLFPAEDDLLAELRRESEAEGIPPIHISPEQGAFMQVFLRATGARSVIEVGTLAGYSSIIMARALPEGGHIDTLELEPKHADFARRYIEKAGLSQRITVHTGPAAELLAGKLNGSGPYDFAFIDADKPEYVNYMKLLLPMIRVGGVIAGDNALARGQIADENPEDPSVRGMQEFNLAMSREPRLQSSLVPVGDGMCIGVVLDEPRPQRA